MPKVSKTQTKSSLSQSNILLTESQSKKAFSIRKRHQIKKTKHEKVNKNEECD